MFLFVKQKTAYEMRISDWSSDVCSSDLCRYKLADHYRTRGRQAAQTDWLDEADELLAVQDNAQAEARRDLGKLLQQLPPRQRLPIVHEIGRASCRERVCQDG